MGLGHLAEKACVAMAVVLLLLALMSPALWDTALTEGHALSPAPMALTHTRVLRHLPDSMLSGTRASWSPKQPLGWLEPQEVQVRPCCREQSASSLLL